MLRLQADVRLWTHYAPAKEIARKYPINRLDARRLIFPKTGTFLFVGSYYVFGRWPMLTMPRRIILLHNTPDDQLLTSNLVRFRWPQLPAVEMVYASKELADRCGIPGIVELSPIDLERFSPPMERAERPFAVGRLSRDSPEKHHPGDAALYHRFADSGYHVRIMGGASLQPQLAGSPSIEVLATLAEDAVAFLHGLDCFYYRTTDAWPEPYGRVVFEAMACGLPIVVHRAGGYAKYITHGLDGFLFDTADEAERLVGELAAAPALRKRIGLAARSTVEQMYGDAFDKELSRFYLS